MERALVDSPIRPCGAPPHRWALVLAGGSGTRLSSLTTDHRGVVVPKQFCSMHGGRSLLRDALARADALVGRRHVVIVVAAQHEDWWRRELQDRDPRNVIVQPQNRGTGPGVLLPLLSIAARDPLAQVTLLPSDHFVADEPVLAAALREAQVAATCTGRLVLVGVQPESPETEYGWILPGGIGVMAHGTRPVQRFLEKPERETAKALMDRGAVWNSLLTVGSVGVLLRLYEERLSSLLAAFLDGGHSGPGVAALYRDIPDSDFCRDLLTGAEEQLGLRIAPACGWTDLGTPPRVAQCARWLRQHRAAPLRAGSLGAAALAAASA